MQAVERIKWRKKIFQKTNAMIVYMTLSNKNLKKHIENARREEKFQNIFVVPNF